MPFRRLILIVLISAFLGIASCAPAPAADTENPPGGVAQTTITISTLTPQTTARPTLTAAMQPIHTPRPTNSVSPTASQAAQDIVLPGWVPEGARARLGRGKINEIALSPDGERIAVAGAAGLFLYRSDTYEEIWSVPTDQGMVKVVFSADGQRIATVTACIHYPHYPIEGGGGFYCDNRVEVFVWKASDGSVIQRIDYGTDWIEAAAFARDGGTLFLYGALSGLSVWEVSSGKQRDLPYERESNTYPNPEPTAVVFSNDIKLMAELFTNGIVVVSDVETGKTVHKWKEAENGASVLVFSSNNSELAVGRDSVVSLWKVETGEKLRIFDGSRGRITALAFTPTGTVILAGDDTGNVAQWNTVDGHCQRVYSGLGGSVHSVLFLPYGRSILTAVDSGLISYDFITGDSLPLPKMNFSDWRSVQWQSEGRELALEKNGTISFWDAEDFSLSRTIFYPQGAVVSPDYAMYAEASSDGNITVAYVAGGRKIITLNPGGYLWREGGSPVINADTVVFSPDGRTVGTAANNWKILVDTADLWDIQSGALIRRLKGYGAGGNDRTILAFPADDRLAAVASFDAYGEFGEFITVFDSSTGRQINVFDNRLELIFAFSSDDRTLISGCSWHEGPGSVCLYDIQAGTRRLAYSQDFFPFNRKADAITSLALSTDGGLAVAGTLWGNILIWDATKDRLLASLRGHTISVSGLAFSPDGKRLASASDDGSVVIWDLQGIG